VEGMRIHEIRHRESKVGCVFCYGVATGGGPRLVAAADSTNPRENRKKPSTARRACAYTGFDTYGVSLLVGWLRFVAP